MLALGWTVVGSEPTPRPSYRQSVFAGPAREPASVHSPLSTDHRKGRLPRL